MKTKTYFNATKAMIKVIYKEVIQFTISYFIRPKKFLTSILKILNAFGLSYIPENKHSQYHIKVQLNSCNSNLQGDSEFVRIT